MNRFTLTAMVAAMAMGLAACSADQATDKGAKADTKAHAENPRPVRLMRVQSGEQGETLILPGEVRPRYEQRYGFRVGGKLARRMVEVGQSVKPGDVLAVMDSADVMPAIAAQRAQLEAARTDEALQAAELKRVRELRDQGFVSGAALERQEALTRSSSARTAAAQSQLNQVNNGLNFQTLRAERAGVVVGIDADVGSVVAAGQSVVRVAQSGEKELVVAVPERSLAALRAAKSIRVVADAVPGQVYTATLRELAPSADPLSRTYAAKLAIQKAGEAVQWGMSGTAQIVLTDAPTIVVPDSALYTRDATPRVWVLDPATQTVQPVAVSLGASTTEGVQVTKGLKNGDLVVTAGANLLQPGQKVRRVDDANPATKS
jgi:RND family efflux transporter MFP subunit